jgi:hypothetical protein
MHLRSLQIKKPVCPSLAVGGISTSASLKGYDVRKCEPGDWRLFVKNKGILLRKVVNWCN